MVHELSPGKTVCILAIMVGCFAILWPNILYPMLKSSILHPADDTSGCCDVLSDKDVNGVKLISELCNAVLKRSETHRGTFDSPLGPLTKNADIEYCRSMVLDTCGVDIRILLRNKIQLDPSYKHVLEELRTFNKSLCLKYHFDITLDLLGAPHRVKKYNATPSSKYHRQERSPNVRPRELHPAFRKSEKMSPPHKRTPPRTEAEPRVQREKIVAPSAKVFEGKKPLVPGMRPPMGGGGHVQSQKGTGTMGVLMPMYTVGIVIFFGYTIVKLLCKKQDNSSSYMHDPEFCRIVFNNNSQGGKLHTSEKSNGNLATEPGPKLVVTAISSLLQEVNRDILERETSNLKNENFVVQSNNKNENSSSEAAVERNACEDVFTNSNAHDDKLENANVDGLPSENNQSVEDTASAEGTVTTISGGTNAEKVNGTIRVVGMEVNESCENGQKWNGSPRISSKAIPPPEVAPQEIILPGNVPINSRVLVSDARTENVTTNTDGGDSSVILESKVLLNVISPDLNSEHISKDRTWDTNNDDDNDTQDIEYENGYSNELIDNTSDISGGEDSGSEEKCEDNDVSAHSSNYRTSNERNNSKEVEEQNTEL